MGGDLEAFKDYMDLGFNEDSVYLSIPRRKSITDPLLMILGARTPSHYLLFNIASSAQGPIAQAYGAGALERQARETARPSSEDRPPLFGAGEIPANRRTIKDILQKAAHEPMLAWGGGGVALPMQSTLLVDPRTIHNIGKKVMPDATPRDLSHFQTLVRHHEAAHLMLDLKEPGGDFVAAVLTLRQHPEARGMLRQWADYRLLQGISWGGGAAQAYGAECHDAIEHALDLPPEKIRSMSLQEMYVTAQRYDFFNAHNAVKKDSPEQNVHNALTGWDVGRGLSFIWDKVTSLTWPITEEVGPQFGKEIVSLDDMRSGISRLSFPKNSYEAEIVGNVREALGRTRRHDLPAPGK
jgi:hypothetical protein